jgi:hypothetical protein
MGMAYYAFSLFIAALVCLIGILYKLLFGNVKQQRRLLDEKEANLLQLYQTVESIMDGFNDQIRTAMDDIKEYEIRAAAAYSASHANVPEQIASEVEQTLQTAPVFRPVTAESFPMTVDSTRIRAASEVLERAERMVKSSTGRNADYVVGNIVRSGEVVQHLFDDVITNEQETPTSVTQGKNNRDYILELAQEGKTQAQIAQELGITQNEVKLVIDLMQHLANS